MTSLLTFDAVSLTRGGRLLFEELSFALEPGEALHVAGPNGSGKSSLLRLAAGLLREDRGRVERTELALADDRLSLDPELPLGRALDFWGGRTGQALQALDLEPLTQIPVRLLSSGQAKRATLARVAASGARLWLLDEPLNALDDTAVRAVERMIRQHLDGGGAIVAASHQTMPGDWRRVELGNPT